MSNYIICNKQQRDIIVSLIKTTHLINHSQNDKKKTVKTKYDQSAACVIYSVRHHMTCVNAFVYRVYYSVL